MYKVLGIFAVLILIGGGCAGEVSNDTDTSDNAEVSNSEPVPFGEMAKNILEGDDEFKEFRYTHEDGTCVDVGAPEVISYLEDEGLGYFVIESGDGEYTEDRATGLANNKIKFNEVPLTDGEGKCEIQILKGADSGTYSCFIEDIEVCSSTVSGIGILR